MENTENKKDMRKKWSAFVNQINVLSEPFDFFIEFMNRNVIWVTFNETADYKMHTYALEMDVPDIMVFMKTLRTKLASINSDEEAIFMYKRLNKTNKTLLETIQAEASQRKRLYQFIACFATAEKGK